MHISDCPRVHQNNTIPTTKCTKMTEEGGHRLHGMNGNAADNRPVREDCHKSSAASYGQGGRLKFFKDGKFILELERAREGERVSWVSVHRKTFWPPQGTATSIPAYRQESSTSLSVSDDNSSIQSSPWQRDHSWKQTNPKRNASKELTFYFFRSKNHYRFCRRSKKRRAPYSTSPEPPPCNEKNFVRVKKENGGGGGLQQESSVVGERGFIRIKKENDGNCTNAEQLTNEKGFIRVKRESDRNCGGSDMERSIVRIKKENGGGKSLLAVVQRLLDKGLRTSTPPRAESVVSPRKRFLREMERDKPQTEDNCHKKSRNKPQTTASSTHSISNGVEETLTKPVVRNSNYSITSLLSEDRHSPGQHSATTQQQQQQQHPYGCPSTEDRWYSESVDRLRSIELSHAEKCGYPPYHASPYLGPYTAYPYPAMPPYYGGYVLPSTAFHSSPLPMPSLRDGTPSCSWGEQPSTEGERREDAITDMPLNLSKHSG